MVEGFPYGTTPVTALPRASGKRAAPVEAGTIARILASPGTTDFVRTWLGAALGRDPLLAYQEAATLVGMLELLTCAEARAWLLPALTAALQADPEVAFSASVDIAQALKPAATALQRLNQRLPEPANCRGTPGSGA